MQHYGTKAKDQYVILSHKDGTKEKLQAANVVEYRTEYANREEQIYQTGRVYVNEFVVARARTRTENGVTAYVDKTVFPFPEGIVTTFKAVGAKFQGAWHLIALEQVERHRDTGLYNEDTDNEQYRAIDGRHVGWCQQSVVHVSVTGILCIGQ